MDKKTFNPKFSSDSNIFFGIDENEIQFFENEQNPNEKNLIDETEEKKTEEKKRIYVPDWKLFYDKKD